MLDLSPAVVWGYLARAALALFLLLLTLAVARRVKRRIAIAGPLPAKDPAVAALISNLVYVALIALGVATILPYVLGIDLTAVLTALGVTGLAISLALQDVLRNFIAGIYILLEKPFNIGDRISLRDFDGEVQSIELRTTLLRTQTGAQVIVPNSVVMTDIVTNRSLGDYRPYAILLTGDRALLQDGLTPYLQVLQEDIEVGSDPAPEAVVESIEAENVVLRLDFHSLKGSTVVSSLLQKLEKQFPAASVTAKVVET